MSIEDSFSHFFLFKIMVFKYTTFYLNNSLLNLYAFLQELFPFLLF